MKIITAVLMAIGVLAIICVLLVITGFLLYSLTPGIKNDINIGRVTAESLESFNKKIDDFRGSVLNAAAESQRSDFTLALNKEEINSKIVQMMAEKQLPVKELLVSFEDNLLWTYFALEENVANAKIGLIASPEIVRNNIRINIVEFYLGRLPLPNSINKRAEDILNVFITMQNPLDDLPLELKNLEIVNNQLLLTVTSKPLN